jgi:beta-glucosidase
MPCQGNEARGLRNGYPRGVEAPGSSPRTPEEDPGTAPRPAGPAHGFPTGFEWGAATAAYQIEGGIRADGRGESIWDRFTHTPGRVDGGDTGDVACDHHARFLDDVALMGELGLHAYRFSVAWPRVIPNGSGAVNAPGLDFYDRLVDALLEHGIRPFPTLYHWDLPQALEDAGGWPVRPTAEAFARYAGVVADRLGDRVDRFATLNEPFVVADHGYRLGTHAPGRVEPEAAVAAAHHLLLAHGWGLQAIRAAAPSARAGIVLNFEPQHPASADPRDVHAAAVRHDAVNRWFLDPLTGHGYPPSGAGPALETVLAEGDLEAIGQPLDLLGVNYYSREVVRDRDLPPRTRPDVERTAMGWEVYPEGLGETLRFVVSRTGDLPLYITENGAAYAVDPRDPAHDPDRVRFLRRHVEVARGACAEGIPLRGYFVWSLLDNFEWARGYGPRFGIVHVDYATQARIVRGSGRYWASLAAGSAGGAGGASAPSS